MAKRIQLGDVTNGTLDSLDAEIGIDNGDIVIRDSNQNIALRYDEGSTSWQFEQDIDAQQNDINDVNAVSTDSASVANAPTVDNDALRWQEGVESGTYVNTDGSDLSGASDDGWGTDKIHTATISFDSAFDNTPTVVISFNRGQSDGVLRGTIEVTNVSTSGFDVVMRQYGTIDHAANNNDIAASWFASEGR